MCVGAEGGAALGPLRSRETACVLAASRAVPVRLVCLRISADLPLSPLLSFAGLIAVGVVFPGRGVRRVSYSGRLRVVGDGQRAAGAGRWSTSRSDIC